MSQPLPVQRRGYPLIALFLVITACGMITSLVAPAMRGILAGTVGPRDALAASGLSSLVIMSLGGALGLLHYHRGRGFAWGIIIGGALGILVGPLLVSPREALGTILSLSVGGTIVVACLTLAYRLAGRAPGHDARR